MKKFITVLMACTVVTSLLSGCGEANVSGDGDSKSSSGIIANIEKEKGSQDGYIVNIDESFDSGIEVETARVTLSPEEADFRSLKWGMTRDEVINAEGTGFREPSENIMYYTRVREEEFPADAEYTFVDEKLAQGIFYITDDKEDNPIEIEDYVELVESLHARFGEPQISEYHFYDESVATDDQSKHTDLILQNKLHYRTAWLLDDTELRVVLLKRNNELCIGLQYKQAGVTIPTE